MKSFHLAIFIAMILFSALQWNDIDGPIWVFIYLVTALLALIAFNNKCAPCTMAWAMLVSLFAIYMLVGVAPGLFNLIENNAYSDIFFAMNEEKPYIEQSREALGLLIILFYCLCVLLHTYKMQSNRIQK